MIANSISVIMWFAAVACFLLLAATEYANNVKGGGPWRTDLKVWFVLGGAASFFAVIGWLLWN